MQRSTQARSTSTPQPTRCRETTRNPTSPTFLLASSNSQPPKSPTRPMSRGTRFSSTLLISRLSKSHPTSSRPARITFTSRWGTSGHRMLRSTCPTCSSRSCSSPLCSSQSCRGLPLSAPPCRSSSCPPPRTPRSSFSRREPRARFRPSPSSRILLPDSSSHRPPSFSSLSTRSSRDT